jgi:hypothetical protein
MEEFEAMEAEIEEAAFTSPLERKKRDQKSDEKLRETERDAARYRWLVSHGPNTLASIAAGRACESHDLNRVNELVDSAIRQSESELGIRT